MSAFDPKRTSAELQFARVSFVSMNEFFSSWRTRLVCFPKYFQLGEVPRVSKVFFQNCAHLPDFLTRC
jgi:hypothetical protein